MRPHSRSVFPAALLIAACMLGGCDSTEAEPQTGAAAPPPPPVRTLASGDLFPAGTYKLFAGGAAGADTVDLGPVLGKKPVLLYYWIPGHPRAEEVLAEVQALGAEIGRDRLELYGVAVPRPGLDADAIRKRVSELAVTFPVIEDADFRIGKMLQVQTVPNITLIDADGRMQLSNGASLRQVLGYKLDLASGIRQLSETGTLVNYGYLDRYFPAKELEGEPCPDFRAPLLADRIERRFHKLLDDSRLNVLIFWSVDCPHCRKSLPAINSWLRSNPDGVNVLTAASVSNEAGRVKTREFCEVNDLHFTNLIDQDARIGSLYRITSTPTIVIIGPDGVIDTVITSPTADIGKAIGDGKRRLLAAERS